MILNLTQHTPSIDQMMEGVGDASREHRERIRALLTFDTVPTLDDMERRAVALADIVESQEYTVDTIAGGVGCGDAMIGGAPYFMPVLERVLLERGITVHYAFSVRDVVERGGEKTSVFRHAGFYTVRPTRAPLDYGNEDKWGNRIE